MTISRRSRLLLLAILVISGVAGWLFMSQRTRAVAASPAGMLRRLPAQNAVVLFADFEVLRRGGALHFLTQSKATEEPDYRAFVRATGFDYSSDLDLAAASFGADGEFFLVKGRFQWAKLESYTRAQGGSCDRGMCRMAGSAPDRNISFFLLQSNLLALAVSNDSAAAARLSDPQSGVVEPLEPPRDPVWLSIPADSLKTPDRLPSGARLFASALASADKILLSLGPQGPQLEARLAVTCHTAEDAAQLAAQLQRATSVLRDLITKESQKPNPKDLSGVLTAGVFEQTGRRVLGHWPLPSAFLESLAGGTL